MGCDMAYSDMLDRLAARTGEEDLDLLSDFLASAEAIILARRYPFGDGTETLETRYKNLQYRIALAMYNKRGGEWETAHTESGVSRSWGSEGVPAELLNEIVPIAKVGN